MAFSLPPLICSKCGAVPGGENAKVLAKIFTIKDFGGQNVVLCGDCVPREEQGRPCEQCE